MVRFKIVNIQNGKHIVRVNADHGRDVNPLDNHMTKLKNFTKGKNSDFSAFRFSLHIMLEQALSNLIVCLMTSQKLHTKVAQKS